MSPLFIGNFRSGTTLLVNLLGLHEQLAPWFETKALCEPLRWLRVLNHPESADLESRMIRLKGAEGFFAEAVAERMLSDFRDTANRLNGSVPSGKGSEERYPIGHDYVLYSQEFAEQAVRDWVSEVRGKPDSARIARATGRLIHHLGNRHAEEAGKPFWINKTPEITRFGPELRACLGSVRVLMMIRNGRDVVRSATKLGWATAEEVAFWWQGLIEQSRQSAADAPNAYMELRYEDLLAAPEMMLDRVLGFIGLSPSGGGLVERYTSNFPLNQSEQGAGINAALPGYLDADFMKSLGYS
jgi:hypothetical protein